MQQVTYEIVAPNGKTYQIEGPEGASDEDVQQAVLAQFPDAMGDAEGLEFTVTDDRPEEPIAAAEQGPLDTALRYAPEIGQVMATSGAKMITSPIDLAMEVGGGISQGITTLLTEAPAAALDVFGADSAAQFLRNIGQSRREDIARDTNQLQFRNALEQVMPTPKGFENSAMGAELVAGLAMPFKTVRGPASVPRPNALAPNEAQQIIAEGARRNVPVMTSDVRPPRSGMGRLARATAENIPFAGTSGPRATQQAARQDAVRQVVEEFGGDTTRALFDDSETLAAQVSGALTKARGEKIATLKSAKDGIIDGATGTAPATKALQALDEQIAAMVQRDTPASRQVAEILRGQRTELAKPRTLRGLEDYRADELSKAFDNPDTPADIKTVGEKALRKIYDPLRQDMGDFIEATSGAGTRAKWAKANEELSAMAGELDSAAFRNVLRSADITPDKIKNILFSNAADPADIKRLVSGLDAAGKRKVQGALLTRAWEKAGGEGGVSVEVFLNNLKTLSNQIGVAFQGADRESIEGIRKLLEATRRASGAAVTDVPTGVRGAPAILGVAATDLMGGAGAATVTLGVGGLVARLYESAGVRNLLIGLAKSKPGSPAERTALNRIMKSAAPIIQNWQDDMARVANDNVGIAAAAEEPNQ